MIIQLFVRQQYFIKFSALYLNNSISIIYTVFSAP